jgi:hypothetical protein
MTDEQINAAIAEACGWTDIFEHPEFGLMGVGPETHGCRTGIENYTDDLNAMHEAEKVLTEHQNESIYPRNLGAWKNPTKVIYATARQRAEAFLRTLGKWEETVVKDSFTTEKKVK